MRKQNKYSGNLIDRGVCPCFILEGSSQQT